MFQSDSGFIEPDLATLRQQSVLLEQSFGLRRLVWGRDWPHTQHEDSISYGRRWSSFTLWSARHN